MASINGQPFLAGLLIWLESQGVSKVVLAVGYMSHKIIDFFGNHFNGIDIIYSCEPTPLGTGGAVSKALDLCNGSDVFLINGDTFFDVDLNGLAEFHYCNHATVSLALKPLTNFSRYGSVELSGDRVTGFLEKKECCEGVINGGIYALNKKFFSQTPDIFSLEKFLEDNIDNGIFGKIYDSYFIDIGIPDDYAKANRELNFG